MNVNIIKNNTPENKTKINKIKIRLKYKCLVKIRCDLVIIVCTSCMWFKLLSKKMKLK